MKDSKQFNSKGRVIITDEFRKRLRSIREKHGRDCVRIGGELGISPNILRFVVCGKTSSLPESVYDTLSAYIERTEAEPVPRRRSEETDGFIGNLGYLRNVMRGRMYANAARESGVSLSTVARIMSGKADRIYTSSYHMLLAWVESESAPISPHERITRKTLTEGAEDGINEEIRAALARFESARTEQESGQNAFSRDLEGAIKSRNLSLAAAAEMSGISYASMRLYIRGDAFPRSAQIRRLTEIFPELAQREYTAPRKGRKKTIRTAGGTAACAEITPDIITRTITAKHKHGYSYTEIAHICGIDQTTMSALVRGVSLVISGRSLNALEDFLNRAESLPTGSPEMPQIKDTGGASVPIPERITRAVLAELRRRGISRSELAREIGVSPLIVSKIARGAAGRIMRSGYNKLTAWAERITEAEQNGLE